MVVWHYIPDTGFEIRALAVWGRARYLSVTEAPHNIESLGVKGEETFYTTFQAMDSKFEPGGLRQSTLPVGHGGSSQYWIFRSDRGRNISHHTPDTGFEIRALAVWGRVRYLSVTEAFHNIESLGVRGEETFYFFETSKACPPTLQAASFNHCTRGPVFH